MKGIRRASIDGNQTRFNLEERLLILASAVIDLSEELPQTRAGLHVGGQILRSGTSPYSNHGEAEAAESRDDFIHKMGVCLKELRETRRWARLVHHRGWCLESWVLGLVLAETDELVRVFSASIQTARRNRDRTSTLED
jgi:four helix bundle protein